METACVRLPSSALANWEHSHSRSELLQFNFYQYPLPTSETSSPCEPSSEIRTRGPPKLGWVTVVYKLLGVGLHQTLILTVSPLFRFLGADHEMKTYALKAEGGWICYNNRHTITLNPVIFQCPIECGCRWLCNLRLGTSLEIFAAFSRAPKHTTSSFFSWSNTKITLGWYFCVIRVRVVRSFCYPLWPWRLYIVRTPQGPHALFVPHTKGDIAGGKAGVHIPVQRPPT